MQKEERITFARTPSSDFVPLSFERTSLGKGDSCRFSKTGENALYYFGPGEFEILRDGKKTTVKPETLIFVPRDEGLAASSLSDGESVVFRLVFISSRTEALSVFPEEGRYIPDTFQTLWDVLPDTSLPEEAVISKLFEVMYTVSRISLIKKNEKRYVARACAFIDKNYGSKLSVSEIAESLSINRQYLSRLFRQKKGVSVQQYIINTRLNKSLEALDAGYSVSETAALVGYGDQFGFTRIFSKKFRMSPTKYKLRNKEE